MAITPVIDPVVLDACLRAAYSRAMGEIPIVTGNLRERSKKIERVGAYDFKTFFRVDIAPYADWVNNFSPKSAGWLLRFADTYCKEIEIELRKVGYIV